MILYLYIQIKELQEISFNSPINDWLKTQPSEITIIELDNHSESFLVSRSTELIPNASRVVLHLDLSADQSLGSIRSIFEALRKFTKPILALTVGQHKGIMSMLKLIKLDPKEIHSNQDAEKLIANFLNS